MQNLLIITAIKADKTRVKDYIHRLDNFDGPAVGEIAVGYEMFEEAFEIYKKFGLKVMAIKVRSNDSSVALRDDLTNEPPVLRILRIVFHKKHYILKRCVVHIRQ